MLNGQGIDHLFDTSKPLFAQSEIYTADQLGFGQIEGHHHFSLGGVDWRAAWSPSLEDQPDASTLAPSSRQTRASPAWNLQQPSTLRSYGHLNEFLQDYAVDVSRPFETGLPFTDFWSGLSAQLKTGLAYTTRDRNFTFRRFRTINQNLGSVDLTAPYGELLVPQNYGDFNAAPFAFKELTQKSDNFTASQEIAGVYGMLELPLIRDRLRFVGGVRLEYSYIKADGFTRRFEPAHARLNDLNPLPAAMLVYSPRDDMNVRAAFSQTVSRPDSASSPPPSFPPCRGSPPCRATPTWSPPTSPATTCAGSVFSPLELASASFFYKDLKKPIEIVSIPETSALLNSFINADSATVWGFELEGRKNFNFLVPYARGWRGMKAIAPHLADVQILTNVSIVESEVQGIKPTQDLLVVATHENRQLQGQAPFVINAALEYEDYRWGLFRLLYNTVGPTLVAGGVDIQPGDANPGLPDIFQEQRDQLDFVWIGEIAPFGTPLKAKFAVENILNDDYVQMQGDLITNRYFTGVTFSLGVSYTF